MNITELREQSVEQLHQMLKEKRATLREKKFKASEAQLAQIHTLSVLRKEIAQIETVLSELMKRAA
jgi:ribosomal protein L29